MHRSGGVALVEPLQMHMLWLEAVRRDGQPAFLLHDPEKAHPDHYSVQAALARARVQRARMELDDSCPEDRASSASASS